MIDTFRLFCSCHALNMAGMAFDWQAVTEFYRDSMDRGCSMAIALDRLNLYLLCWRPYRPVTKFVAYCLKPDLCWRPAYV